MDWARAIAINGNALARVAAALVALVGVQNARVRLPKPLYRAALALLRPAEAALRRLIVIAAKDLAIKVHAVRKMPAGLVLPAGGGASMAFPLFDPRPRLPAIRNAHAGPRIRNFGAGALALARPMRDTRRVAAPGSDGAVGDDLVDAENLDRRIRALKGALEDLPRQAKRLRRWEARRARMDATKFPAKFRATLRPGFPPGYRAKKRDEVGRALQDTLRECHALALDVLRVDSS